MKVLITGVAGFLCSHLAQKLLSQGNQIIGIDNMMGGYEDNIPQNITFHKNDCCDYEKMSQIMKHKSVYQCSSPVFMMLHPFGMHCWSFFSIRNAWSKGSRENHKHNSKLRSDIY